MAKKHSSDEKLSKKQRRRRIVELVEPFKVTRGRRFRLRDYDPDDSNGLHDKEEAEQYLRRGVEQLAALQDKLYAQDEWGVLLIFQAMDAAGKDGAIKHVMSGVNPQGCQVYSFKAPSSEELDHDFLWRDIDAPARARPHRHLQPLLLRGGAGRARAPRDPATQSLPRARHESGSGSSATRTSAPSSATSRATAPSSSSSS